MTLECGYCDDCRWWEPIHNRKKIGKCQKMAFDDFTLGEKDYIATEADFGCRAFLRKIEQVEART